MRKSKGKGKSKNKNKKQARQGSSWTRTTKSEALPLPRPHLILGHARAACSARATHSIRVLKLRQHCTNTGAPRHNARMRRGGRRLSFLASSWSSSFLFVPRRCRLGCARLGTARPGPSCWGFCGRPTDKSRNDARTARNCAVMRIANSLLSQQSSSGRSEEALRCASYSVQVHIYGVHRYRYRNAFVYRTGYVQWLRTWGVTASWQP